MVRMMALFDLKDYLTLEDLSEYLNKIGFSYEIVNENEYCRLVNDVSDLLEQHKMTAVFPFTGMTINKSLYLTKVRGGGNGYDIEDIQDDCFIDGYFYLDFNHFLELKNRELKTYNKNFRLYSIKSQFNPYEEYLQSVSTDDEKRMEFFIPKVKNNIVKFSDIRFPRLELDKLFIQLPQADTSELVQQVAELQKQLEQVKAENQDLQKALLQKQVNDDNLNAFLYYPSDDRENDLKQLANHYDKTENEVIQELFNEQLDDIKPMVEFIQYIEKNNIQDENINRLFDLIKQSGQSIQFFSALSKAGFVPQATQPSDTALDDEMETKSLNAVSRLVYVLLDMAEYDLSTHSGNGNTSIIARSERLLQKPLSKKFVSDWIKNAQTAKIEYGKK